MLSRAGASRPTEPPGPAPPPTVPSPSPAEAAAALERVRSSVHRWLDRIADLASSLAEAEHAWARRCASLEEELDRRQREFEAQFEALELDRHQLALAWERLEREQVAAPGSGSRLADEPSRLAPPSSVAPPPSSATAPPATRHDPRLDDAVNRTIVRQFEALRKDVRRTAEARGAHSP
ncbi:hypothetical protein [Tautonia sociabilis]|uniref:Uncharacterized protein n=1 Tax=Tautonia sociabilis TaxID=2080755 RepID=A0A432MDD9_9BACT|nr:hypothetical protein [Tautonia sociabilis]RUL81998.1 hypothetical protein TsocGM_24140 [Tautonia sociabilis]